MGKKIVVGTLAALVIAGSAFAYSQIAPNYEITPTPYNPPAITAEVPKIPPTDTPVIITIPTENQTPAKPPLSLEDKLADRLAPRGQLSDTQIEKYTLDAYEIAYNNDEYNREIMDLAKKSLGRVIDSVVNSIFEGKALGHDAPGYDELLALRKTDYEFLYWKLEGEQLVGYEEEVREQAIRLSNKDKDIVREQLREMFFVDLGSAPGKFEYRRSK